MRFAVIGAGTIGQLRAQSIKANPGTELLGVADPTVAQAERAVAGSGAKALSDWRAALSLPGVQAVMVSSPIQFHEEAVLAALHAGLHVLCEKPMSNTVESCRRMLDAARASGRTLATGFNHRYYPAMKFLKQAIDDGQIGAVDHVRIFGGHDGLHNFRADWQYKAPVSGGGAMMDVGIHMTDLARFVLGEVSEVYGVASNRVLQVPGSEDNAMAIFKSPSGVAATYEATWTEWKGYQFYVEAYGEKGMVRGSYAPMQNVLITQDRPGAPRKKARRFYPEIMVREKLKSWTSTALVSFQDELVDFLRMANGEKTNLADAVAGFRAVEMAHAVYQSSKTGKPVALAKL
ncbi:MAG: Gfo/Idh/MocA family oxidoreductase [Gemmatimonadota bacterium]